MIDLVTRNRPSQKPQFWEDALLATGRRLGFEINRRARPGWVDRPQVVELSAVGMPEGESPLRIEVTPREAINRAIFLYGTFELSETRLVQALLRPGMTFVDVGAHIGYYTLIGSRLVGPTGHVHGFEPGGAMGAQLAANVARNRLDNVVIHREALAHQSGEVGFYPSLVAGNQGISSILAGAGRGTPVMVPSLSLDDFAARLGARIDLLKMDIEGAELQVIEGGQRTLRASDAPPLIFEAHDLAPVAEALHALGYHIRRLDYSLADGLLLRQPEVPFHGLFDDYEAPNYFAAKDESVFDEALRRAQLKRRTLWRVLGRI